MIQSQVNENMHSFKLILSEVNKLQESEVLLLLHILLDRIQPTVKQRPVAEANPFHKYRGRAKGVWTQDAQAYVNAMRDEERF